MTLTMNDTTPVTCTSNNFTPASGLGSAIADRRSELGLTQQQLAERAGIARPTLGNIERGVKVPRPVTMGKLDKALEWPAGTTRSHAAGQAPHLLEYEGVVKGSTVVIEPRPGVTVEYVDAYGMRVYAVYPEAVQATETDRQSLKIWDAKGNEIGGVAAGRWISYTVEHGIA